MAGSPGSAKPRLIVLSGAGLSAESGLDTFRDAGGLWTLFDPDRVCNFDTFREHRTEVYKFYNLCKTAVRQATPNPAHQRLADWQGRWGTDRVLLLTANVDDLLERAQAQAVIHLHGDLRSLHCTTCQHRWGVGDRPFDEMQRCPSCQSRSGVKPGVVLFEEQAPEYTRLDRLAKDMSDNDIVIVVGTSLQVIQPDRFLPGSRLNGHPLTYEVNPNPSAARCFGKRIAKVASEGLAEIETEIVQLMA